MSLDVKQTILDTVGDTVKDLLFYDRKEDAELGPGAIQNALANDDITFDEIVEHFRTTLGKSIYGRQWVGSPGDSEVDENL